MTKRTLPYFGQMIRITLRNGKKIEFRDTKIQRKDRGRFIAIFDRSYRILAEFASEDVLECLERSILP